MRYLCTLCTTLTALSLYSAIVDAAPVPISNHSFEAPDAAGGFLNVVPDGWLAGGGLAAQWVENNGSIGFSGGDGAQHAGLDTDGGYIYQDLGVPFAANTIYTIDLAGAHRSGSTHGVLEFGLFSSTAIGTDVGTPGFMDIQGVWTGSGNPDGDDQFNQLRDTSLLQTIGSGALGNVYSHTTDDAPPAGNLVVFIRDASGGRNTFDNIRLDATLVPEPGSVILLASCGLALIAGRRRR